MWGFGVLLLLFFVGVPFAALLLAAQARRQAAENRRRMADLELAVGGLRGRIDRLLEPEAGVELPTAPAEIEEPAPVPVAAPPPPEPPERPPAEAPPPPEPPVEAPAPPAAAAAIESPEPPPEPPRPPLRIDWEQWIGVRGAAVLGGIVLALAAILFLKFSIERGLIPPIVRVALAVMAGLAALVGSEWLRKRDFDAAANSLSGAGVVVLYAAIWAARVLYELIPSGVAFVFMVLVTLVCGLLSWRHRSLVIAILGLTGGFATPLLLSTGQDRPIGLFGYILLLDVGLLALARRRGWPVLATLSLAGTAVYEALWIFERMGPDRLFLGLTILAVFGLLFAAASRFAEPRERGDAWRLTSYTGVLLPFLFALYFATRADLGEHLLPIALLMALLGGAALWLARLHEAPVLAAAGAAAVVAVVLVWLARTRFTDALAWEAAGIALGLALLFQLFGGMARIRDGASLPSVSSELTDPALLAAGGLLSGLLFAHLTMRPATLWPWLLGWVALAGLLYAQGSSRRCSYRRLLAAAAVGVGFMTFWLAHGREEAFVGAAVFFGLAVLAAIVLQLLAVRAAGSFLEPLSEHAAAILPAFLLFSVLSDVGHPRLTPAVFLAATIVPALLIALAATRLRLGPLYLATVGLLALLHTLWVDSYLGAHAEPSAAWAPMLVFGATVLLFTFWPSLSGRRFAADRWALYGAALSGPAWFRALQKLFLAGFGSDAIGVLPVSLALVSLAAAALARRQWSAERPEGRRSLVWFLAVTLSFVTLAIPLQLEKEWVTLGWALQGAAMIALWKRLDHPGLKYFGLGLLTAVTVRLIANPAVLGYYETSSRPVFNWLMYTYLVPAAALLAAARTLFALEVERLRDWEAYRYPRQWPLGAAGCGLAAVLVVFVWINLTIVDAFSPAGPITLTLERLPARDLTLSLAWAVYAIVLLAIGMAGRSVALRWVSLAFLILTIGKVFLYDLGELRDLYRVASLVGLAASLIAVSLAYQKFVFPKDRRTDR